jgi:2-keto-4-pentenoate hydratase
VPEDTKGMIRTTDYAFEQARRNASDIAEFRQTIAALTEAVKDLLYIAQELTVEKDPSYGEVLNGHMAALTPGEQNE